MQLGMVGLGRMGANMTKRLIERNHDLVVYDRNPEAVAASVGEGARAAVGLEDLVAQLVAPRHVWVMVPAGSATNSTVGALGDLLERGDTIVDGGNSRWRHAQEASARLAPNGIFYVDAGVSGGVWGLANGYCLMVGGEEEAVRGLEPIFTALAPEGGYAHVGPSGAGHYVKMVHNGIEYGMLQAYAEGFALMESATELGLDLHKIAKVWQNGSVVRSWLLDLTELSLADQQAFSQVTGHVEDSGEGRWTIEEGLYREVPLPVITASLFERFSSRRPNSFSFRVVAALRNQFGGHRFFTEAAGAEARKAEQGETPAVLTPEPGTGATAEQEAPPGSGASLP